MKNGPGTLVIRADAGSSIGTGHVMRCLALGQAWQDLGGEITLVSRDLPPMLAERMKREGFRVELVSVSPGGDSDAEETAAFISSSSAETVVVDGYHFSPSYCQNIRDSGCRVVVIDDFGQACRADMILNQNLYASADDYPSLEYDTTLLAGSRYALLRREFKDYCDIPGRIRTSPNRILVSCGGSDPRNATEQILKSLGDSAARNHHVTVVVGGNNGRTDQLRELCEQLVINVRIEQNCQEMADLMNRADLAIVAAGGTCLELAFLGVPLIAVVTSGNQIRVARAIEEHGLGWNAGWARSELSERIPWLLSWLDRDRSQMSQACRAGRRCVDGLGAMRVAQSLADPLLKLRPASPADRRLLWQWRNDRIVREASFSTVPFSWEEHCCWFKSRLQRSDYRILIAENRRGQSVGQARLDLDNNRAVISISIAAEFRGRGYGTALIRAATNQAFVHDKVEYVDAFVRDDNRISAAAFMKAEYQCQPGISGHEHTALHFVARNPRPRNKAA